MADHAERVDGAVRRLVGDHPRQWRDFDYVYPVLSRRSGGLSVGVNLNVDKVCNWDCVYCQVDRAEPPKRRDVDLDQLRAELDWILGWAADRRIWADEQFADVPEPLRRINDIAFSGDGEPTTYEHFDDACAIAAELKAAHHLDQVKLIVLTNMTMLHRPQAVRGLAILDQNQGEIWAKLEAGTEAHYRQIDRSAVKFSRVLDNIRQAGRVRPIVIQSLFMHLHGQPAPDAEFEAYLDRLTELLSDGCQIKLVQLYTTARRPAEPFVTPLTNPELDTLAARLHHRLPNLPCQTSYGLS